MPLTFEQIILDARKLVVRISDHETTADNLICEIQSVCNQIANMKQYREEVDVLNAEANQRPHLQLIAEVQREDKQLRELQAENKELRNALEEHQNALELIMSKYRQQTASLLRLSKTDLAALNNAKYTNVGSANVQIITRQAEKINEMASVMKTAIALDEESEQKHREEYYRLKEENATLRELINIANEYGSLKKSTDTEDKTVQTDPVAQQ